MKKAKIVGVVLGMFVVLPIWCYLPYQVLVRVGASELMWFLFWAYLPVGILVHCLNSIAQD